MGQIHLVVSLSLKRGGGSGDSTTECWIDLDGGVQLWAMVQMIALESVLSTMRILITSWYSRYCLKPDDSTSKTQMMSMNLDGGVSV